MRRVRLSKFEKKVKYTIDIGSMQTHGKLTIRQLELCLHLPLCHNDNTHHPLRTALLLILLLSLFLNRLLNLQNLLLELRALSDELPRPPHIRIQKAVRLLRGDIIALQCLGVAFEDESRGGDRVLLSNERRFLGFEEANGFRDGIRSAAEEGSARGGRGVRADDVEELEVASEADDTSGFAINGSWQITDLYFILAFLRIKVVYQ